MDPETKNRNSKKVHNTISVSEATYSQKKPEKPGFFRRLLDWIARGAAESHVGKTSCPT